MPKQRIDQLLVERGLAESREQAQRLIRSGVVRIRGRPSTKPGKTIDEASEITVDAPARFVSRGGKKLQAALDHWLIDLRDAICLDIGASTGGFTDAMLQAGARRVYAIDVGRGQLAWKLRQDERVVVMEKVNARYLTPEVTNESADFAAVDVSFISLTRIFPALVTLLAPNATAVTLIKPQFEAGREQVGKGGVVRDPEVHRQVQEKIVAFAESSCHLSCEGIIPSPVRGPAGNIEFLAWWTQTNKSVVSETE